VVVRHCSKKAASRLILAINKASATQDMINEKLSNSEGWEEQPPFSVSWERDVYSQVLGNEKTGYVLGLGLGSTPFILWGSRSSFENIIEEDSSNEFACARMDLTAVHDILLKIGYKDEEGAKNE
ncbi:hypothetical protein HAX54_033260, partial [Datura stramonium]|nr:hypothetical protein [Datura stramonium]